MNKFIHTVSQDKLLEVLNYNATTGIFTWKKAAANNVKINSVAGCLKSDGYINIKIKGVQYRAHRLAWIFVTGACDGYIDHIDHDRSNNCINNLRLIQTESENSKNSELSTRNTSGVVGVCWSEKRKMWIVQISINCKQRTVGYFKDMKDAIAARKTHEVANSYHANHGAII